jgi:hypothetical protein
MHRRGGVKATKMGGRSGSCGLRLLAAALGMSLGLAMGLMHTGAAFASEEDAPEILSSDLGQTQSVDTNKITATFVFIGSTKVKTVKINGETQTIEPGDTVQVTKTFDLKQSQTVITVSVEDEQGNKRERNYVVNYGAAPAGGAKAWSFRGVGEIRYEVDDNPTNDVGLPFTVSGVDVKGVIPVSQRPDMRQTASGTLSATYGGLSFFGGALRQQYEKSINSDLNTTLSYAGAGYRFHVTDATDFITNLIYSNLNIGNADYANLYTLSGAFEIRTGTPQMFKRHTLELDATEKSFVSSSQTSGVIGLAKWDYYRQNPATLTSFESLIQGGNSTEGQKLTDYSFIGGDWDWHIRWNSGFRWDLGTGYQYRSYPNDSSVLTSQSPFASTRVDNLLRVSTGFGWQWNPLWAAMLNYRYLTDLSNKSPYVRDIYGLQIMGGF